MLRWSKGEILRETGSHKLPPDVITANPSSRQFGSSPTARKLPAERFSYREYQNEQPEYIKIRKPSKTAPAICKKLIVIPSDGTMTPSIAFCSQRYHRPHCVYPPSQKTTGLPVDECANNQYATARCRPEAEADNRVVAEGEDGYFSGTTGLPVGLH